MLNPAVHSHYYEAPASDPNADEIWCYCDRPAYSPGDRVSLQVSTSAKSFDVEVARDGIEPEILLQRRNLKGERHDTPVDAYARGCG